MDVLAIGFAVQAPIFLMFQKSCCSRRRAVWFSIAMVMAVRLFAPTPAYGEGISLAGITEGGVVAMPFNVAATNLTVTATPSNPAGNTNVSFVLEFQGNVILNRTCPPPYSTTFSNLSPGKYFLSATLAVAGTPPTGDVSFDISPASLTPANDNWSQAAGLSLDATALSSNISATSELNEPVHGGKGAGKSIWWSWTAISAGNFTATTAGSTFDTVLGVYTGTNLNSLVGTANDDAGPNLFSQLTFSATAGQTYYFAVDSASTGASGEVQLRLTASSPPTISVTSPTDGVLLLVQSPLQSTNILATASIADLAGVTRVDYWFDDGSGVSRSGILAPPYQLNLTNLFEGHYLLTFAASNNAGLVSLTNIGISVISLAPVVVMEGFIDPGILQMGVTGFKGPTYALQASTNLDVWCSVKSWTNFTGAEKVADTNAAQFNQRFYRAQTSP